MLQCSCDVCTETSDSICYDDGILCEINYLSTSRGHFSSASKIPLIPLNPQPYFLFHNTPPLIPIQIIVSTLSDPNLFQLDFNIILQLHPSLPSPPPFHQVFPTKILYAPLLSHVCYIPCPSICVLKNICWTLICTISQFNFCTIRTKFVANLPMKL